MVLFNLKRWAGNSLLILSGLAIGALILEAGLRVAGISYPSFYTLDEHAGYAFRPGAEGWYRAEGESYVRINRDGLRDMEHTKLKPANTLRIAVLGDSFAGALEVPMENAFWAVMERELEECVALTDLTVEVINLGVNGYGTAQELITLRHQAWDYDPDIVVLAFVTGNDISGNSRTLAQDPSRPHFIYRGGELVLDASFIESEGYRAGQMWYAQLGYRIVNSSRILQLANEVRNVLKRGRMVSQRRDLASEGVFTEPGLDSAVYLEPSDSVWAEAWRVTEGLILLLRDEVMGKGASFLVVTMSNGIQVHPDPLVREDFMESVGVHSLFYPDLRIKELGEQEGFSVLNLAQPLHTYAEEHGVFLHGFENTTMGEGHWNAEGHRLAGQMIGQKLCRELREGRSGQEPSVLQ